MTDEMPSMCPLCSATDAGAFAERRFRWGRRRWLQCQTCDLVFVAPSDLPSHGDERDEYLLHENSESDAGYVEFLSRLTKPLTRLLPPPAKGLDYGCGPAPVLSSILEQRGYAMAAYDPFFAPAPRALKETYDFVTCTEVIEHFHQPALEFSRMADLIRPHGLLGMMTSLRDERQEFLAWHYIRERSHVAFYSEATLLWIAERFGFSLISSSRQTQLLRRTG